MKYRYDLLSELSTKGVTMKDMFDFYCELREYSCGNRVSNDEVKRRAKFMVHLNKYHEVKIADRVWKHLWSVMNLADKDASIQSKRAFREAKDSLIGRINCSHYDNVGNWIDSYSDFDYAINAVRLWAEVVGFFNNGVVK